MKRILTRISAMILCVTLMCSALPIRAAAGYAISGTCRLQTDSGAVYAVKTLDYGYDNNTYLSLRDIAIALTNTEKAFSLDITNNTVSLNLGADYVPVGTENAPWGEEELPDSSLRRNECKVNGETVFYYTLIMLLPEGYYDCFMMAADLAMILDVNLTFPAEDTLQIFTQESFEISPVFLEQTGYFCGVNSVLAGDATTGEIYYQYQSDVSYPIASTSKLMTCLLAMDAISAGHIAPTDLVTVSEAAQALADSADGVIALEAGKQITVQELLFGALLPSSNECALCLAESVSGSEEAFVRKMNEKALELGLSQAVFYNSHGLPSYTQDPIPAKRQNRMSAEDMFRLASHLLRVYPQITEITSQKKAVIESLNLEIKNTNPLLHNLPAVTGLKTGTTNKAGACLVTSLTADDGTMEHDLVVVVLGAEDSVERGRVAGLLAQYALQTFYTGAEDSEAGQTPQNLPTHGEAAVDWILKTAEKRQKER
ncbi:MAG: D-alanyl-D-alanine carboxypeptidase [Lachnospiraceae bacterium]|nr:D-alanyl-D-alanine carboxypeptidase [Lachnospiraceae bacterium]